MEKVKLHENSYFIEKLNTSSIGDNIDECLSCGACNSSCSWFDGHGGPVPRQMIKMAVLGLDDALIKSGMLWDCLLCNRCTQNCPMGITMSKVVRIGRSHPRAFELISADIQTGIKSRLSTGDVNGLTREDFIETIEWMAEEFAEDVNDPNAKIPYDLKGARFLYLPNPRELGINLLHLSAMAKLFYASNQSWTMSSKHTDVTNWGYFVSDDEIAKKMALMVIEPAEALGIETLVLSECGHGYHVLKVLAEKLIGRKPEFQVISMPEFVLRFVKKGIIKLDKTVHPFPTAYHDPCNLGRKSGLYDAPRQLLALCCKEVVELIPNRENAVCCGGGGGMLQDSTSKAKRMITGKAKADQIIASGVKNIAAPCLSCHRQIGDISKHFKLGVKVDTIAAMASRSLVLPRNNSK
ncbi:MAG: (Fe-S)-binding protein [Proteobacteria bacterium]|nr:(Fe-S)-binding protein [Pseudomonadota bacterium]MBU1582439.1 (Fe-S)-binding protein [Pseudomonadota bacterium]MBU2453763.1 (Fe-S)-binding protein [Pseudomonadota bacterium]MBU2627456.1 (Fe-S)-binding protein [Pseudomonadota bacterium]